MASATAEQHDGKLGHVVDTRVEIAGRNRAEFKRGGCATDESALAVSHSHITFGQLLTHRAICLPAGSGHPDGPQQVVDLILLE